LLLLLLLVSCALMTLKSVVISSIVDNADMTATTVNIDFIVIGAARMIV
jgi:hypothetical protein